MPNRVRSTPERGSHFIREWRRYRGLTQQQLADRIGTTKTTISRLENRQQPYTQDMLEAIADALRCEPADLIMRDPRRPSAPWTLAEALRPLAPEEQERAAEILRVAFPRLRTGTEG